MSPLEQQAMALAGVAQAARIVDQLSKTGSCPNEFLKSSIHSLFAFEAEDTAAVFGGVAGVKLGLHNLMAALADQQAPELRDLLRYFYAILHLERRFAARPEMMEVVHSRLKHSQLQAEHFSDSLGATCGSLSAIYQDTLSQLSFRIKVTGSAQHLQDTRTADQVRAALLSGVRAAFLWHQLGGRRWKLLVQRRRLLLAAQALSRDVGVV